jgi:uncharacterized protein YeaO (DUF488 family)
VPIRIVRLGAARHPEEGIRIGTARRPPRGVKKEDYSRLDYYDVWLPELAPSAETVSWAQSERLTPKRWAAFVKRYKHEMAAPAAQRVLTLLAALSLQTNFSVGCYCADESECHRTVLRELFIERGAKIV